MPSHFHLIVWLLQCVSQGGECGVPFWKRMLMPVSDHPWVDAEAQRRPPEWYSYNYGSVRQSALAYAPVQLMPAPLLGED